jgi:hypothetical protein
LCLKNTGCNLLHKNLYLKNTGRNLQLFPFVERSLHLPFHLFEKRISCRWIDITHLCNMMRGGVQLVQFQTRQYVTSAHVVVIQQMGNIVPSLFHPTTVDPSLSFGSSFTENFYYEILAPTNIFTFFD